MITAKRWSGTFLTRAIRLSLRLSRNERGSMSALIAIGLTVLLGFAALGVDVSLWLRAKNNVQAAADAAANSVTAAAAAGNPAGRLTAEANAAAAANGFQNGMNGVTVTMKPAGVWRLCGECERVRGHHYGAAKSLFGEFSRSALGPSRR